MDQNSQQDGLFDKQMKIKRHIKKIAITQIVLSVLCIILGIVGTVLTSQHNWDWYRYYSSYSYSSYYIYFIPLTGTGIWSSVCTLIAGGIGMKIGSPRTGEGMKTALMVFAIIGCVSESSGLISSAIVCTIASLSDNVSLMAIYIILCILSFISFSLLVTTSAFCCKLLKCCCGSATDCGHQVIYAPQTMVQTPHGMMMMQQPAGVVMMQQPQGTVMMQQPQGTVMMQQPQGTVMMQQPQGTVMMQQPQGTAIMQQPQGSVPQYSQPQSNSQDTNNLNNSEETVQPQEMKIAPPSYS